MWHGTHTSRSSLEAGFFDYLTKPIKVGQFMDALDSALAAAQAPPGPTHEKEQA